MTRSAAGPDISSKRKTRATLTFIWNDVKMKRLAFIGGLTKAVIDTYWNTITTEADKQRGAGPPPPVLVHGFNAREYADRLEAGDWRGIFGTLLEEGRGAQYLGAECLVVCGSALNPAVPMLRRKLKMPVIDLGAAVAEKLRSFGFERVGLLGVHSRRERLMWEQGLAGIEVLTPPPPEEAWLRRSIADALAGQPIPPRWVIHSFRILSDFTAQRAQAVVIADHTLTRWIKDDESLLLPLIDAATTHAWAAALCALHADPLPALPCGFAGEPRPFRVK